MLDKTLRVSGVCAPWSELPTTVLSILGEGPGTSQSLQAGSPRSSWAPPHPHAGVGPGWQGPQSRRPQSETFTGGELLTPVAGSTAQRPVHTWSFSPTFTIIMSPTISIQLVPQGLCELTPLRNHTWESQKSTGPRGGSLKQKMVFKGSGRTNGSFGPSVQATKEHSTSLRNSPHSCCISLWAWHCPTLLRVTCP